jgi:hypothetical protein
MKVRKVKNLEKALKKKGFILNPEIDHHKFYYLHINGIKYPIYTYLSHGIDEYGDNLMSEIKKQLKFDTTKNMENFFDCPLTKEKYIKMLKETKIIKLDS